jgi:hypothetical protein
MMYQNEDDPTLVRMTSLNFGLERRLVAVTGMLDDVRHFCHHYQDQVETLEERLVEANTTLAAINAAREAAETCGGRHHWCSRGKMPLHKSCSWAKDKRTAAGPCT